LASSDVTLVVLENGAMKSQPAMYRFTRVKSPEGKGNVFITLSHMAGDANIYMAINDQDVRAFTKLINDAIDGNATTREKIISMIDNNTSIVFPRSDNEESMSWICFPSSFEKDTDDNIVISFEWIYYGEEREIVLDEIQKMANSKEMISLVSVLKDVDAKLALSGSVEEINDGLKVIAMQFGLESLDSRDPVDLVKEIKHYKDFGGKYIMKEIMTDAKIILVIKLKTAMNIADGLASAID